MNDEDVTEPLIHLKEKDGVLALCFNRMGKAIIAAIPLAAMGCFAWVVNLLGGSLDKLDHVNAQLDRQSDQIVAIWKKTTDIQDSVETNRVEAREERDALRKQAQANAVAIGKLEGGR